MRRTYTRRGTNPRRTGPGTAHSRLLRSLSLKFPWLFAASLSLFSCSDQVDSDIAALVSGGPDTEEAGKRLGFVRLASLEPLIAAFEDRAHPIEARLDLASVLSSLHQREPDRRIEETFVAALRDSNPEIRSAAVTALGKIGRRDLTEPVLQLIERERNEKVQLRCFLAVELLMGIETTWMRDFVRTDRMSAGQRQRFTDALVVLVRDAADDSLRSVAHEWLEVVVAENADEAHGLALKAQMAEAEEILLEGRNLLPDSMHMNFKLGRLTSDNYNSRLTTIRIPVSGVIGIVDLIPCNIWRLDGYRRSGEETDEADPDREDVGCGCRQGGHGRADGA